MKADTNKVARSARLVTPVGRLSYPSILRPTTYQEGDRPRYSCSLLLDKEDPATEKAIKAIELLQKEAASQLWGSKEPRNFDRWGIIDGDETDNETAQGHYIVKGNNYNRPAVVDSEKSDIIDESQVYGGVHGRLNLVAKAYGTATKGGVTLELLAVQVTGGGAAFGGAAAATQAAASEF